MPTLCTVWPVQNVCSLIKQTYIKFCIFLVGAVLSFQLKLAVEQDQINTYEETRTET